MAKSSAKGRAAATTIVGPRGMKKMYFVTTKGKRYSLGLAATGSSTDVAANVNQVDRPGRLSIVRTAGRKNRTLSLDQLVTSGTGRHSVESTIRRMRALAESGARLKVSGGGQYTEGGIWWVPTALSIKAERRSGYNNYSRATLSWTFVEWSDASTRIKTKKAKKRTSRRRTKSAAKTKKAKKPASTFTYRIRSGDTLGKIAARYLGKASAWRRIYTLNRRAIGSPNRLKVGTKIKIPRK